MVSAISLCLLAVGLTAVSSQLLSAEVDSSDAPLSDRRTFKHGKPLKLLPLVKKHKKFPGFVPHVFGKTSYAEVPIAHEVLKPLYKVHRYQGIEVKPLPDLSLSTPEPIIETHSAEPPPPPEYEPAFAPDYSFPAPLSSSSLLLYPVHDKPIFSASPFSAPPPAHVFPTLPPPPPPKPVFQFVPAPPQPVFSSLPITPIPSLVSIPRPAPAPIFSQLPAFQAPVFTSLPPSFPSNPPQPIFSPVSIKVQPSVLPPLPSPSPAPIFSSVPIKLPPPVLPPVSASPSPPPVFSTVSVTPPPLAHALPSVSPPLPHAFPSLPPILPPSPSPSPLPISSLPPLPSSPAPPLSTISIPAPPEPNFPYPPSGVPIPSFIKDISLPSDIHVKDSPLPTIETPTYDEVTPTLPDDGFHKSQALIKPEEGLLQRFKGWKADKATAALNHLQQFKQKPFPQFSLTIPHPPTNKIPSSHPPAYSTLHLPTSSHPLPLAQAPVFFPSTPQFFPPAKYESFPPNNIDPPPIFNSYGVPIPQDSYAAAPVVPVDASHDRLSSAASEEDPAVVPAPTSKKDKTPAQKPQLQLQQRPSAQLLQEFHTQNFQQQPASSHVQPIYVPEDHKTIKEETKEPDRVQPEVDDYSAPTNESNDPENSVPDPHAYSNHKE